MGIDLSFYSHECEHTKEVKEIARLIKILDSIDIRGKEKIINENYMVDLGFTKTFT